MLFHFAPTLVLNIIDVISVTNKFLRNGKSWSIFKLKRYEKINENIEVLSNKHKTVKRLVRH